MGADAGDGWVKVDQSCAVRHHHVGGGGGRGIMHAHTTRTVHSWFLPARHTCLAMQSLHKCNGKWGGQPPSGRRQVHQA